MSIFQLMKKGWVKLKKYCRQLLLEGISPFKLSLTICLGVFIGIMPVIGVTTIILLALSLLLKLNIVLIQLVNYLVYPLQILLYIPFLKAASLLSADNSKTELTFEGIKAIFQEGWLLAIISLWDIHLSGLILWLATAGPVCLLLFFALRFSLKKWKFVTEVK